jgi:hypothetical protein
MTAFFIKTWTASDTQWNIQWMQCKHFLQSVVAYYATTDVNVYQVSHLISTGTYPNSISDTSSLVYWDFTSNRGQASDFIMEFDLTTTLSSTTNFNFLLGSNYYLKIAITGVFFAYPTKCEISGGLSNSYGQKPTCIWISSTTMLINNFDNIDLNALLSRYRLKVMFASLASPDYTTGYLYPISAMLYLYSNYDAYYYSADTIFTLSTNSIDRRMTTIYYGPISSLYISAAGTLIVNSFTTTSTSVSMSLSYTPSSVISFSNSY